MNKNNILEDLYQSYFQSDTSYSRVTSSHWKVVGKQTVTRKTDGSFDLHGLGFGHRISSNIFSQLCHIPELILVKELLSKFPEYSDAEGFGRRIARKQSFMFGYDCLRQSLAASYIKRSLEDADIKRICVIGDGYGYTGALLKSLWPDAQIIEVNLGRTLMFDVDYIHKVFPTASLSLATKASEIQSNSDFLFLAAEQYEWLQGSSINLFVNISSMQEMSLDIINNYLSLMRSSSIKNPFFYCCNRVEKQLPDGEVVLFEQYGWSLDDMILDDELCPWYKQYPASLPPFWRSFDGPIRHRLVRLAN